MINLHDIRYALRLFTDSGMLYVQLPGYFDQEACFTLASGAGYSADMVSEVQGKRLAQLQIELWVPEVAHVDYVRQRVILDYGRDDTNIRDGNVYPTLG